jgi:predicted extracellular nuclease
MKRKLINYLILLALLISLGATTAGAQTNDTIVFINEIHYDNTGTDTGEAIEVAGPAGTDLTGWSIVLYNGANGLAYDTDPLSGVIPDQENGFGTLFISYPTNGIQNGSPDGLALLDASSNIIQFLSYEGTFTAVDGPAAGMTSTDIGVSQNGSGAVGNSLQLKGSGAVYEDFTWAPEEPNTFGAVNTGQSFGGTPAPDLVINEIDYDQPGTDAAEFIEIRNNGDTSVDLTGWALELVNGTGGGAALYSTIDLSGFNLVAGGYFVVCANASTVANCDLDVSPDTNLIQNGAPDAVGLRFNGELIDAVSYEGDTGAPYTEGSGAGLVDDGANADEGISRCPDGVDTDQNSVDFVLTGITPGSENDCAPPPPPEDCGDSFTPIYSIQGSGLASPLVGSEVSTEGIVVGDFQENDGDPFDTDLDGFYIQDASGDGDAATSDGIFVFAPGSIDVSMGDLVRVRGTVTEFFNLTEIGGVNLLLQCPTDNSVTPTDVSLPVTSLDDFEAYEGMLVTFQQSLHISEYFNFDRFGEIVLTTERQFQPTAIFEPGSPQAAQLAQDNLLSRITLDDARSAQNPDPAVHPNGEVFDLDNLFRGGDVVENVTGVMDFRFSLYRIQPTEGADYAAENPRPDQPADVGGNLKVASFNVLNYFTTIDDGQDTCGPTGGLECRGADTPEEFERQRAKIIAALSEINADVVGLIEIENHPGDVPTADLVSGLNDVLGAGTYDYIATGAIGTDAIRQAFIYKPATVSLVGDFAVLDSDEFVDPNNTGEPRNRPALAQTFMDNETGGIFTAVVNHFKSKGSPCGPGDDDPQQGNCNVTRTLTAQVLADWLATDPTGSNDADLLIMGDLNSYDKENPIDVLAANGYTDLVHRFEGELAYSFVFDGQLGYLDYALANADLLDEVTGLTIWHINADEPDLIDYDMTFKQDAQDALFEPNAFRSSDHDPVINGLDVCDEIAPTLEVSVTPDTLWPPDHRYVEVQATVIAADNFDPNPTVTLVSVTSNEPDDGEDDGNTVNDIVIIDDFTFNLRAERSGVGTGRIYTITYQVSDACGNVTEGSATVSVPLNLGR